MARKGLSGTGASDWNSLPLSYDVAAPRTLGRGA